jgi:hypothetical protein
VGSICPSGATIPLISAGYYRSSSTGDAVSFVCIPQEACLEAGAGNTTCAVGYDGIACANCAASYFRLGTLCKKCLPTAAKWSIIIISGLLMSGVAWRLRNSISRIPTSVRIAMSWFQMFSLFSLLSKKWPEAVLTLFNFSKFMSLELQYFGFECDLSVGYWFVWALKLSMPLFILLAPIVLMLLRRMPRFESYRFVQESPKTLNAFTFFLNFFYTCILGTVFEPFNCIIQGDGKYYMIANPSQVCFDQSWHAKIPGAVFFALFYVIAFPAIFLWIYFTQHHSSTRNSFLGSLISFLLVPYKKELQFWEWIKLAYKFFFVLIRDVGTFSSDTRQLFAVSLILTMLCLEILCTPFAKKEVNTMSIL